MTTDCHVRATCIEEWKPLQADNADGIRSILKFLPELKQTPPEVITCPKGLEDFTAKVDSERERIVSQVKIRSLSALKKDVFRDKSYSFHWDLSTIVENRTLKESGTSNDLDDPIHGGDIRSSSNSKYTYDIGSFVAINNGFIGEGKGFWIASIVDAHRGKNRRIESLSVHWYEFYGSTNVYTGRYKPLKHENSPWVDQISTETILLCFPRLTSDKRLPAAVSHFLREHSSTTQLKR